MWLLSNCQTEEQYRETEKKIEGTRVNLTNEEASENTVYTHTARRHIWSEFDLHSTEVNAKQ